MSDWVSTAIMSLALQYSSTCISMPFEVGKMLLQVQWVPKDDVWNNFAKSIAETQGHQARRPIASRRKSNRQDDRDPFLDHDDTADAQEDLSPEAQEWRRESDRHHAADDLSDHSSYGDTDTNSDSDQDDEDDDSSPSDVEAYFRDAAAASSSQSRSRKPKKAGRDLTTDSGGYLVRKSVRGGDASARPEFVMPIVVRGGVWEMIKAVARGKEGWYGLWKGTFTSFLYDLLASGIQPTVSALISPLIPHSLSTLPLAYVPHPKRTLALLVTSHVITHFILSPLDLIRTRLIVQSTLPRHRKYTGPWDALKKILKEEGGWGTIYGHPHLVIPAILDLTLRPFISLASPLVLERVFRVEANTSPVSFAFAELMINTSTLLFTLPIETVRRRMQVQRRASWGKRVLLEHGSRSSPFSTPQKRKSSSSSKKAPAQVIAAPDEKGLRTCVETRPRPYTGVIEAIYRILTEETSQLPGFSSLSSSSSDPSIRIGPSAKKQQREHKHEREPTSPNHHPMTRSEIIAPQQPTYATLGGVKSLYRGFTMAAGANLVVFLLTVVTGERSGSMAAAGGAGGGAGAGGLGGWAEI